MLGRLSHECIIRDLLNPYFLTVYNNVFLILFFEKCPDFPAKMFGYKVPRLQTFSGSAHNKVEIINQIDLFNYTVETENNGFFLYIGPNTLNIKLHFLVDCFRTDQFF